MEREYPGPGPYIDEMEIQSQEVYVDQQPVTSQEIEIVDQPVVNEEPLHISGFPVVEQTPVIIEQPAIEQEPTILTAEVTGNVPTVWRGTDVVDGKTIVTDIGAFGEHISEDMLARNGWRDFTYIKNTSDNGIDIIARGPNGQLGFFEVKTSSTGTIPNLSDRQSNMNYFVEDVLFNAANATGRYQNIDSATRVAAQKTYDEYLFNPYNVTGNVIGVDLQSGLMRISRWER